MTTQLVNSTFKRGPYGEIFPPPLSIGISPAEAVQQLIQANQAVGQSFKHVPTKPGTFSREGLENSALLFVHNMRLRQVLGGNFQDDTERALYEAVTRQGEPLSLRPLSMEDLSFLTFAPVLQAITPRAISNGHPMKWQVGRPGKEQMCEVFEESDPVKAVERAQQLYVTWRKREEEVFDGQAEKALRALPASLFHNYWSTILKNDGAWDRQGGFQLKMLGQHNTLQLQTPQYRRIVEMDRVRAVRLCDALARQARVPVPYPEMLALMEWLRANNATPPDKVEWWEGRPGGLPAKLTLGEKEYALVQRQGKLVLHLSERGQYKAQISETYMDPEIIRWLSGHEVGRSILLTWMLKGEGSEE